MGRKGTKMEKTKPRKAETQYLSRIESQMLEKFRRLTMEIESNTDLCGFHVPGWELREVPMTRAERIVKFGKKFVEKMEARS